MLMLETMPLAYKWKSERVGNCSPFALFGEFESTASTEKQLESHSICLNYKFLKSRKVKDDVSLGFRYDPGEKLYEIQDH